MKVFRSLFLMIGVTTLVACAGQADVVPAPAVAQPQQPLVAAPVPAPAAPEIANGPRSFTVHFDSNKADIRASAMQILYGAALVAGQIRPVTIRIHGFSDTAGNAKLNQKLSEARAAAVADQLSKLGVKVASVETKGFGEDPKASRTQGRRVEVTFEGSRVAADSRFDHVDITGMVQPVTAITTMDKTPLTVPRAAAAAIADAPAPQGPIGSTAVAATAMRHFGFPVKAPPPA